MDKLTYPLDVFRNINEEKHVKKLYNNLKKILLEKIRNWEYYKPIRGKIEAGKNFIFALQKFVEFLRDFFKLCKSGLSLREIHKYTPESAKRTTILTVFLAGIIVTLGYNSKSALQKLSES